MIITYMAAKVELKNLLKAHNITQGQLDDLVKNAKGKIFTIDGNKYTILKSGQTKTNVRRTRKHYTCTKGDIVKTGLAPKDVKSLVELKTRCIYPYLKDDKDIVINGWAVELEVKA